VQAFNALHFLLKARNPTVLVCAPAYSRYRYSTKTDDSLCLDW
jgi:hypothetical protein